MKKNLLLILMFITMFFIGSTDTYALRCVEGEKNCKNFEEAKDSILKEINSKNAGGRLACMYEVKMDSGKTYYTYIYYSSKSSDIYAGNTYNGTAEKLSNSNGYWIKGAAYDELFTNYQCPEFSYLDYKGLGKEVCFDSVDDKSGCQNNEKNLNAGTNFNFTISSERRVNDGHEMKFKEVSWTNACNETTLPEEYKNKNFNTCKYSLETNQGKKYVLYYYNNSESLLIYNNYNGERIMVNNQDVVTKETKDDSTGAINIYKDKYQIKIPNNISKCPNDIYLNLNNTKAIDSSGAQIIRTTYERDYTWDNLPNGKNTQKFSYISCKDKGEMPESVYENCGSLLEKTGLQEDINDIMTIIRIAIPIMLIALIAYDMVMAVLSGSDDKIKKSRDRIFKRIVIAIVIFFVPTFINLIFGMVNEVWGTKFETCGIAHFTE